MLDFQTKQNLDADPAQFLNESHDAAEFNSTNEELKNAVLSGRQTLTALVDYATEVKTALGKSIIANAGMTLKIDSYDGGSKTLVLVPRQVATVLPDFSTMDLYTFQFYVESAGLPSAGVENITAFGTTLATAGLDSFFKTIKDDTLYTVMYIQGLGKFIIVNQANYYPNLRGADFTPTIVVVGGGNITDNPFRGHYNINGRSINFDFGFTWYNVDAAITSITIPFPIINGYQIAATIMNGETVNINILVPFKDGIAWHTIYGTINQNNIFFDANDNPIFAALVSANLELNFQASFAF